MKPMDLKDDIVVFDIDGVLAKFIFENGKKFYGDEKWIALNMKKDMYESIEKTSLFNELIETLNPMDMYILSTACTSFEQNNKTNFINSIGYFREEHIIFVGKDEYKKAVLEELRNIYDMGTKKDKRIVMIEDTCKIMADIEELQNDKLRCFLISDFI